MTGETRKHYPVSPSWVADVETERGCSAVDEEVTEEATEEVEEKEIKVEEREEEEGKEARRPNTLRDPGAPTPREIEEHNVCHIPYRSWCPSCVSGKARDKPHRSVEQDEKILPEVVFDYCFMGVEGEETVAIQVARDRKSRMLFAHAVPRKGMTHEHGAAAMVKDLAMLGHGKLILKCDGEPALRSVQEEVKSRREQATILENSPVGDSRANGAAERAVQAVQEQVRVLRHALEARIGAKIKGSHPIIAWLIEHAADVLNRYHVGEDGRTPYERLKGKRYQGDAVEFGERIHYKLKKQTMSHKLEFRWDEGYYLGKVWRTGEAIVGTNKGIVKAGTIRRAGAHRRWDAEGLESIKGLPWHWNPEQEEPTKDLRLRWLTEEEKQAGKAPTPEEHGTVYRLRLKREDFLRHGFTEGCPGCRAMIAGSTARGHHEACRQRMESAIAADSEGQERVERQNSKVTDHMARVLEKRFSQEDAERRRQEQQPKKPRQTDPVPEKRSQDEPGEENPKRSKRSESSNSSKRHPEAAPDELHDEKRLRSATSDSEEMALNLDCEAAMQEDMEWGIGAVSDMCQKDPAELNRETAQFNYHDENTGEVLDPSLVEAGERDELARFQKMGVYDYVDRDTARSDPEGKFVKVKWVRVNKGSSTSPKIRCRLVAQELAYGERLDELFAGTPPLIAVKLVLHHAAKGGSGRILMLLDVKCAFLYGQMKRRVYIELPEQDPRAAGGSVVGVLVKAMYGTRDAPQIWADEVRRTMESIGMRASQLQPSMYYHAERDLVVVVHVDDFLCSGSPQDLDWLYAGLHSKYDLTKNLLGKNHNREDKYLNRLLRWTPGGWEFEGDPKHARLLAQEWNMEHCKGVQTPSTKEGRERLGVGELLADAEATRVRRAIARLNYMSLDRVDLAVAARAASQHMSAPREGTIPYVKRVIRYLKTYPRCVSQYKTHWGEQPLTIVTDSVWAGDLDHRRSCSGGLILLGDALISHWSKTQASVALSSGEAELNSTVKGLSEGLGVWQLINEIWGVEVPISVLGDSSACRGMLLRHGAGRVKHLSTKQLWVQEAVRTYSIDACKIAREDNHSDSLTHEVSHNSMKGLIEYTNCVLR